MKIKRTLQDLESFFHKRRIVEMKALYQFLGTTSRVTVFRYLRQLNYLTSYTHSRMYYTLPSIAKFDQDGLWRCGDIGFSKHGTLLDTLSHFIAVSEAGKTNSELEDQLRVRVQNPLLQLVNTNKIGREKLVKKTFLYVSHDPKKRKQQLRKRKELKKKERLTEWVILEILIETIRVSSAEISAELVADRLRKRKSSITRDQVEWVFQEYSFEKKTPDYPPSMP